MKQFDELLWIYPCPAWPCVAEVPQNGRSAGPLLSARFVVSFV